jgi:multiple sugar transport system permease protein
LKKKTETKEINLEAKTPYKFVMPVIGLLVVLIIFPLLFSVWVSLHRYNILQIVRPFLGLGNFISLLTDNIFYYSLAFTFLFSICVVAIEIFLGYLIAKLFLKESFFSGVGTTLFLTPMLIAPVVVGLIWKFMFEPEIGIINYLFSLVDLPAVPWTTKRWVAIISVGIADIWQWTPFCFLVILAGLRGIDKEVLEAADVDGTTFLQKEFNVVFPGLKRIMLIIILIRFIDAFRTFDLIYILTRGGPGVSTYALSIYAYIMGLNQFEIGKGTAIAIVLLIIILISTNILTKFLAGKREKV